MRPRMKFPYSDCVIPKARAFTSGLRDLPSPPLPESEILPSA